MLEFLLEHFLEINLPIWMAGAHWIVIGLGLIVGILVLGKSADVLVEQATELSLRVGIPEVIVAATIVSLGTTTPEAVVSVMAAIGGKPELALGNAVGSIICDTGLILGIACIIAPIPLDRWLVNRQGLVQFGAGLLLVLLCVPWSNLGQIFVKGGSLPQWAGFLFLALLAGYVVWSIRLAKQGGSTKQNSAADEISQAEGSAENSGDADDKSSESEGARAPRAPWLLIILIMIATLFVVMSSELLIAAATETATRMSVPKGLIAATLVAFGTSLPELTIAVTAALKGRGEQAIGNVIGADILNVLFVAGTAAAVTSTGLAAEPGFFKAQFPAMLGILITFRLAIMFSKGDSLPRWAGFALLGFYVGYLVITFSIT